MKDTNGRLYAKVNEVKAGDFLIPDGGFTCMKEGVRKKVKARKDGSLFVSCSSEGGHSLAGQLAGKGQERFYIGLYRG